MNLLQALAAFQPIANAIIPKRPAIPVLASIMVHQGNLVATNLDVYAIMPVDYKGSFIIPLKALTNLIKAKPKNLSVKMDKNNIGYTLKFNGSTLKMAGQDVGEFPSMPNERGLRIGKWDKNLLGVLASMLPYVSDDELKPSLQGISYTQASGSLELCSTDGHRLRVVRDHPVKSQATWSGILDTLLVNAAKFLKHGADASVMDNWLRLKSDGLTLYGRIVDERYPLYKNVIPTDYENEATLDPAAWIEAIKPGLAFVNSTTKLIALNVKSGKTTVPARAQDASGETLWETKLPLLSHNGDGVEIGFNAQYLLSILKGLTGTVTWKYGQPVGAGIFTADDPRVLELLMPIRLTG